MNTPDSVVGCSSCGALYTPGPGDRGVCLDCRRQAAAAQPRPTPSLNTSRPSPTPRPNTLQPVRPTGAARPPMAGFRPSFALRRKLIRAGVGVAIAGAIGTGVVTQQQRITNTWTSVQRHGISREWASVKHKAWDLWVAIRRETPWPVVEPQKSAADIGVTRSSHGGAHHHPQVAATSTKRKGTKSRSDLNSPGSTP